MTPVTGEPVPPIWTQPLPGNEHGRDDDGDPGDGGDSAPRVIARGLLFFPKTAVRIVFAPVRGLVYIYERWRLPQRYASFFFDDTRTYGIVPVAALESGFGFSGGAKILHRNLFGAHEKFSIAGVFGGQFQQAVNAKLSTGDRFGRLDLSIKGDFERHPKDRFFGIGNEDLVANEAQIPGETNTSVRYRSRVERVSAVADLRVVGPFYVRGQSALVDFNYDATDSAPIDELYPMEELVGFMAGDRHAYNELELRIDTRRNGSDWEVPAVKSTGGLIAVFGGRVKALDEGADYWRVGADLQRLFRLGRGPRVLTLRAYGEGVSEGRDLVPFTALPRLGGKTMLRGYEQDRFRDRVAAVGTIEYSWDLSKELSANLFVDAGRVATSAREWTKDGPLRVGYGIGLEAHTDKSFILRTMLATSIDGGIFLNMAFDPVFESDTRVERR